VKSRPLWRGRQPRAQVSIPGDLSVIYPKGGADQLSGEVALPGSLDAPLFADQPVGAIEVKFNGATVRTAPLQVAEDYPQGELWSRMIDWVKRLVFQVTH